MCLFIFVGIRLEFIKSLFLKFICIDGLPEFYNICIFIGGYTKFDNL